MKFWEAICTIYATKIYPRVKVIRGTTKLYSILVKLAIRGKQFPIPNETIMDKSWDYLIILDACRYDLFKEVVDDNANYIISVGSSTEEWVRNTFGNKKYYDVIYISANPFISNLFLNKWFGRVPFFHLETVWDYGWDKSLKTVPPQKVSQAAIRLHEKYPKKKMIIHFMQPHRPFVGNKKIIYGGWRVAKSKTPGGFVKTTKNEWKLFINGKISKKEFWSAYKSNLKFVMGEVKKLRNNLRGKNCYNIRSWKWFWRIWNLWTLAGLKSWGVSKSSMVRNLN